MQYACQQVVKFMKSVSVSLSSIQHAEVSEAQGNNMLLLGHRWNILVAIVPILRQGCYARCVRDEVFKFKTCTLSKILCHNVIVFFLFLFFGDIKQEGGWHVGKFHTTTDSLFSFKVFHHCVILRLLRSTTSAEKRKNKSWFRGGDTHREAEMEMHFASFNLNCWLQEFKTYGMLTSETQTYFPLAVGSP